MEQQEGVLSPLGLCFPHLQSPLRKDFFLPHCCSVLAGAILPLPDLIFYSSFKCIDFFICSVPRRRSCGTSLTSQSCLRSCNNSELWLFSWSWAGPASSMSPDQLRTAGMWHLSASWDSWELQPRTQNPWTHIGNDHSPHQG